MEPRENNQHNFSASICRKKTFTGLYTKWDSFTPRKYKINLICTLALSCYRICLCPLLLQSSLSSWNAFICIPGDPCMSLYFKGHASYYFISRDKKKLSFRPGHLKDLKRCVGGGGGEGGYQPKIWVGWAAGPWENPYSVPDQEIPIWRLSCLRKHVGPFSYNSYTKPQPFIEYVV